MIKIIPKIFSKFPKKKFLLMWEVGLLNVENMEVEDSKIKNKRNNSLI